MQIKWRLELILGVLIALTLGAILGEKRLLQSSIVITPQSSYAVSVHSDETNGGNSSVDLIDASTYEWRCTLRDKYSYPYCGFEILFDPEAKHGLDLQNYTAIRLSLEYQGNNKTTRVYLRNSDPRYTRSDDDATNKFNQIEFDSQLLKEPVVEFSLQDFFVANWWLINHKIPPALSHPQFDNIVRLEIQTGSAEPLGDHKFKLNRVEIIGQLMKTERWYQAIMATWLVIFIVFLSYRLIRLSEQVRVQKKRESELLEINSLLDERSKTIEERGKTDSLTGAFNRQGIEEAFLIGLWEWRCHKKPLSLVIMDIDHFKKINDQHGHIVGDYVLSTLSKIVKKHIRGNDLFARWGGEEFVLVCRDTKIDQAASIAEKIRELIENYQFNNGLKITASFGVATFLGNEPLEQLFVTADAALYKAKNDGRNRVEVGIESR